MPTTFYNGDGYNIADKMKSTYIQTESIWKYNTWDYIIYRKNVSYIESFDVIEINLMKGVKKCTYVVDVHVENGKMPRLQRQWSLIG